MEMVEPIRDRAKIQAMKSYLKEKNLRDYALFTLGINVGLRINDLLKLRVGDIIDGQGRVLEKITVYELKSDKIFIIGESGREAIIEYLESRKGCSLNESLFPSRKGQGPIQRGQVCKILSKAAKMVGIKEPVGTQSLRKTFGYWAYRSGQDVSRIQMLFNHISPKLTLSYIGVTQEEMKDVYLSVNL